MTFKAAQALSVMVDVEKTLADNDLMFETEKWLPAVRCPVLLLHAEDDNVIPYNLAVKLHQEARLAGKENIRFVTFPASLGLSHCDLFKSESLPDEMKQFVEQIRGDN